MHTRAGTYEGYEISFGCPGVHKSPVVVVRGTGTREFPKWGGRADRELEEQEFWRLAGEARDWAGVTSIHAVAGVGGCRDEGWVIGIALHDWRDVDDAIRGLGVWIKHLGLKGEIILELVPVPMPSKLI